jgi:BirA family biotin operon repressor/biotin-[acetyl-CoA-carboxylase] ligase
MNRLSAKEEGLRALLRDPAAVDVRWYDQVGSTMDEAFALGRPPAAAAGRRPAAVAADRQTAGRGRFNRRWLSPPGSLSLSLLLAEHDYSVPYSMVASLAVYQALQPLVRRGGPPGVSGLRLKWVNDVLYNGKKLAGILTEEREGRAVIGMGVNLNCTRLPREVAGQATSVLIEQGCPVDPVAFAAGLLNRFLPLVDRAHRGGLPEVLQQWEEAAALRGRVVRVRCGNGSEYRGNAEGIDPDTGALLLRDGEGTQHLLYDGSLEELSS